MCVEGASEGGVAVSLVNRRRETGWAGGDSPQDTLPWGSSLPSPSVVHDIPAGNTRNNS